MKLPKVYEPAKYEAKTYELWEASGAFAPSDKGKVSFSIVMPPPNANAPLHIGHALTVAIQDAMIRYRRLKGDKTLYLPGADHAGFETWVVYEKKLNADGKTRFDFSREELFAQVWDFVESNKNTMLMQTRAMGASADWSRFTYTLDDHVVKTTYQTFKKMWDDDLIYRGERIVNYCTVHDTSFSDIEVEYIEHTDKLWHIDYPLTDGSGHITVATTRPETMLGDTAVAINPKDERYQEYIGKTVKLPLTHREIPIVGDKAVEQDFGSGAVKVTPAHDATDFDIGQRHDLPAISVIGYDGKMTQHAPEPYRGLTVEEARKAVLADLKKAKLISKEEDVTHSVAHCYKCKSVIEPLLKDQWFVRMQPLAKAAIKAIKNDEIAFYPANKKDHALRYLATVRDWNISRQIAWGIPIPAYRNVDNQHDWIFSEDVSQETIEDDGKTYTRDPDVFDTWFSSGQWPLVTLRYPDSVDFKRFYPVSVMETGGEIFNQWVLRMVMIGLFVTKKVPFTTVYIHGNVQAMDGTKMSKSLGNVINPMDLIAQFGADAMRMGLIAGRIPGVHSAYSQDKIVGGRNFANKLWNIARYIEGVLGDDFKSNNLSPSSAADHWWLLHLSGGVKEITDAFEDYRFAEAYEALYQLVWNDFADWYVEASKTALNKTVLAHGLATILKLAHPFAPFVTETIWQTLSWTDGLLISEQWPDKPKFDKALAASFEPIRRVVTEIRELFMRLRLRENTLYHHGDPFITANSDIILKLTKLAGIAQVESGRGLSLTEAGVDAWLDVEHNVISTYAKDLTEQKAELSKSIGQLQGRLDNKAYITKAPKALVTETKYALTDVKKRLSQIEQQLDVAQGSLTNN